MSGTMDKKVRTLKKQVWGKRRKTVVSIFGFFGQWGVHPVLSLVCFSLSHWDAYSCLSVTMSFVAFTNERHFGQVTMTRSATAVCTYVYGYFQSTLLSMIKVVDDNGVYCAYMYICHIVVAGTHNHHRYVPHEHTLMVYSAWSSLWNTKVYQVQV